MTHLLSSATTKKAASLATLSHACSLPLSKPHPVIATHEGTSDF